MEPEPPPSPVTDVPAPPRRRWPLSLGPLLALFLLILCLWAAVTVDAVNGYPPLKGDEATYISMAFSLAFDGDLAFERKDLDRFWAYEQVRPDGIFLKRGKMLRVKLVPTPPFVRFLWWADAPGDKLYYGKAFVHAVLAAPFVRLFGRNGFLVLNVLLMAGVAWCAYRFALARAPAGVAGAFTLAFFGVSFVPIYVLWYTPEILNLALVFFAGFLFLYAEVAEPTGRRLDTFLRSRGSELAGAFLLGLVTFSKPLHALVIVPFVLWMWWRRRFTAGVLAGLVFAVTVGALFSINAAISGEFNYQGGDHRKIFFGSFPFASPDLTFESASGSNEMVTNDADAENLVERGVFLPRLARNLVYFFIGRHHGLVPYFFPAIVVVALWLRQWREIRLWQVLVFAAVGGTVLATLVLLPYTWNGGGGPPGNRYFLSFYPLLFFLVPTLDSFWPAALAWTVGGLFTAQSLVNPFFAAKRPALNSDHGAVRMLPVELTTVNDLPVNLEKDRCRLPIGTSGALRVYLLDENGFAPEGDWMWTAGRGRADILVRSARPLSSLRVTVWSLVANRVTLSYAGHSATVDLKPQGSTSVVFPSSGGVYSQGGWGEVLSVTADSGFVPMNTIPGSTDVRFLGAKIQLEAVERR